MYGLAGYDVKQNPLGKSRLEMTESLAKSKHWIQIGADITEVCHESYIKTPTGLGPDVFQINNRVMGASKVVIESGTNREKICQLKPSSDFSMFQFICLIVYLILFYL